jgi:molybdopterin/thiamine biosynthesis adenylyltransferase
VTVAKLKVVFAVERFVPDPPTKRGYYGRLVLRQAQLLSITEQSRIKRARVLIVGLGGNGGHAAESLARYGVGHLRLVDPDRVETSNLNRQPYYRSDIGRTKVSSAAQNLLRINPQIGISVNQCRLSEPNAPKFLRGMDVIVDAADDYRAKVALCREAKKRNLPVTHTAGAGWRASVTTFFPSGPTYEEMFDLPSKGRQLSEVGEEEFLNHRKRVASVIGNGMYSDKIIEGMNSLTSPWQTTAAPCIVGGAIAAAEVVKLVAGRADLVIAAPSILQIDFLRNTYTIFEFGRDGKKSSYT